MHNNNPQIDHKVPLFRGGANSVENYQAVCVNCNVVKRGICKHSTLPTCENCYLAFPEKGAKNLLIDLTEAESEFLTETAKRLGLSRRETLKKIISAALNEPFEE